MNNFPNTPKSEIVRIAACATGENEEIWTRIFDLYRPAICAFAESLGAKEDREDITQDVFTKLVEVFRSGSYNPERGRFRSYLATMVRNIVVNNWHKAQVRAADRHLSIEALPPELTALPSETAAIIDAKWRLARRRAAEEHVLEKTALSKKSRDIYRRYVTEEHPIDEVAAEFGVPRNTVSQVKTRVERMIAQYERLFPE